MGFTRDTAITTDADLFAIGFEQEIVNVVRQSGETDLSKLHKSAVNLIIRDCKGLRIDPTLVSNTGWYAEQEDGVVVKCDPQNEVSGIKAFFAQAIEQPGSIREIGRRGRDWVVANHSASRYADDIVDFASRVGRLPHWTLARRFADRASQSLSSLDLDVKQIARASSLVPAMKSMVGMADEDIEAKD